jgi:hypothetical protein
MAPSEVHRMTTWYKDQLGRDFTTVDGKPPSTMNIPVTVKDGSGQIGNATWSGAHANPKSSTKSS